MKTKTQYSVELLVEVTGDEDYHTTIVEMVINRFLAYRVCCEWKYLNQQVAVDLNVTADFSRKLRINRRPFPISAINK